MPLLALPDPARKALMTSVLAYLDPGSGSMILQIIVGGAAAAAVTAKLYWGRLMKLLRIRKPDQEEGPEAEKS
jgi:hypothetical protein